MRSGLKAQLHRDAAKLGTVTGRHQDDLGRCRRTGGCSSDLRWASSVATSAGSGVWTTGTATHQRLARTIAYVDARTVDVDAQCDEGITGPTVPGA